MFGLDEYERSRSPHHGTIVKEKAKRKRKDEGGGEDGGEDDHEVDEVA